MGLLPVKVPTGPPGQPGPEVSVPVNMEKDFFDMDPCLSANLHKYQLLANAMHGGMRMIIPPMGTLNPITGNALEDPYYLFRLPGESKYNKAGKDVLLERVKRAVPGSTFNEILEQYKNYLFRQAIDRTNVDDILGLPFMHNVDGKGTPANDWLKTFFVRGIAQGAAFCWVDYPEVKSGAYASKAHEIEAGNLPYLRIIPVTKLYQWDCTFDGRFRRALIKENDRIFFELLPGQWNKYDKKTGKKVASGTHPIKAYAPIVPFVAQEPPDEGTDGDNPPFGISPVEAAAYMQLRYNQQASLLEDIEEKSNFPFLHGNRDPNEVEGIVGQAEKIGPDRLFLFDGNMEWVSPAVESPEESRKHLDHLEERMYKSAGLHMAFKYSIEAHSGKSLEYQQSPIFATVQGWGSRLRFAEIRIWQMVAKYMGK